jgi:transcription elongation factor Elf1
MENNDKSCPLCGNNKLVECVQLLQGSLYPTLKAPGNSQPLYHLVCKECGTVVRSFVKQTKLL